MYKRQVLSISICLLMMNGYAQHGVKFMEGNFQEALEIAKQQNKMLFVDVYTSWCGPCRWMSEEVLQTPEAAKYFDKYFVCFKIDAEKGDGMAFAEEYGVRAYPCLLYTSHTLSVTGGTEKIRYYSSVGVNIEEDVVKPNLDRRYTGTLNLDMNFASWLAASFNMNANTSKRKYYQDEIAPINYAYNTSRAIPAYTEDGEYSFYQVPGGSFSY